MKLGIVANACTPRRMDGFKFNTNPGKSETVLIPTLPSKENKTTYRLYSESEGRKEKWLISAAKDINSVLIS